MRIIMLGAPGSGKGTLGKILSKDFEIPHISSGDIFRAYSQKEGPLADELNSYMKEGKLIPDELTIRLINERLNEPDTANGFLLDGFPRTEPQAESLKELLASQGQKIDVAVYLNLDDEEIVNRTVLRRTCSNPACKEIYNLEFKPPKHEGICDLCGAALTQRADDNEETIRKRLKTYHDESEALIKYYDKEGVLYTINLNKDVSVANMGIPDKLRSFLE